ncbi:MAG TPA: hypothetical protein VFX59_20915 [Polyangiales bacterium]|nr:hypothetical protein [Polyangiales bacterium]
MDARHLVWVMCATLAFGAGCQRGQNGRGAEGSSGAEALGEATCAREPGEPPQVGEGAEQTVQRPCTSGRSVMGESGKRPEEL